MNVAESVRHIAFALGYYGGDLPVYVDQGPNPARLLECKAGGNYGRQLVALSHTLDEIRSAEVAVGLPTIKSYVHTSTVLWAWVKGGEQVKRARTFKPSPSIVLQIGTSSERLLLWTLRNPIAVELVEAYNSKVSYALKAPRTRVRAEKLRVPMPGTFMRLDRRRPAPILVTRLEMGTPTYEQVAGSLKDPPPKDAWKERKR